MSTNRRGEGLNVLSLIKGHDTEHEERYVFLFDDDRRADCLRTLGNFASNPDLSFTWYDAAVLSKKMREQLGEES